MKKSLVVCMTAFLFTIMLASYAFASSIIGSLPDGKVGEFYSPLLAELKYDGMFGSKTWSIASGSLPPGLKFLSTNLVATSLTGTPTRAGTYTFTVMVSVRNIDSRRTDRATKEFTITILPSEMPDPEIIGEFSEGKPNEPYSSSIYASNGTKPYTWSYSGNLPPGLSLRANDDTYTLSGTPTTTGSYNFSVTLSDTYGTAEQSFTVNISDEEIDNNNNNSNNNGNNGGTGNTGNKGNTGNTGNNTGNSGGGGGGGCNSGFAIFGLLAAISALRKSHK